MFLGHYGLALAAKRVAPRTSLGTFTFAAQFLDELWPVLLLLGVEQVRIVPGLMTMSPLEFVHYPYSHSLLMSVVWAALIGGAYFLLRRYGPGAWVMAALVVSHWFLDLPMHGPDLPLWPGANSPKFGWGFWNISVLTYLIEFTIFATGLSLYSFATRARDRIGRWGFRAYAIALPVIYVLSNGPLPPSERAIAWSALGIWLFVPWAWWVDKHRMSVKPIGLTPKRPSTF